MPYFNLTALSPSDLLLSPSTAVDTIIKQQMENQQVKQQLCQQRYASHGFLKPKALFPNGPSSLQDALNLFASSYDT
jgi:hypothetical protein